MNVLTMNTKRFSLGAIKTGSKILVRTMPRAFTTRTREGWTRLLTTTLLVALCLQESSGAHQTFQKDDTVVYLCPKEKMVLPGRIEKISCGRFARVRKVNHEGETLKGSQNVEYSIPLTELKPLYSGDAPPCIAKGFLKEYFNFKVSIPDFVKDTSNGTLKDYKKSVDSWEDRNAFRHEQKLEFVKMVMHLHEIILKRNTQRDHEIIEHLQLKQDEAIKKTDARLKQARENLRQITKDTLKNAFKKIGRLVHSDRFDDEDTKDKSDVLFKKVRTAYERAQDKLKADKKTGGYMGLGDRYARYQYKGSSKLPPKKSAVPKQDPRVLYIEAPPLKRSAPEPRSAIPKPSPSSPSSVGDGNERANGAAAPKQMSETAVYVRDEVERRDLTQVHDRDLLQNIIRHLLPIIKDEREREIIRDFIQQTCEKHGLTYPQCAPIREQLEKLFAEHGVNILYGGSPDIRRIIRNQINHVLPKIQPKHERDELEKFIQGKCNQYFLEYPELTPKIK